MRVRTPAEDASHETKRGERTREPERQRRAARTSEERAHESARKRRAREAEDRRVDNATKRWRLTICKRWGTARMQSLEKGEHVGYTARTFYNIFVGVVLPGVLYQSHATDDVEAVMY